MAKEVDKNEIVHKRLFFGGLFSDVSEDDVRGRFHSFGKVTKVDIIQKNDDEGKIINTFAYVNIDISEPKLSKCMSVYNKTKWKGHELKMQVAKENYLVRLQKEREIDANVMPLTSPAPVSKPYEDFENKVSKMKNAVPGTEIGEERNWVVGKYCRALPVVYLRTTGSTKIKRYDPSKYCHQLKKLKPDSDFDKKSSMQNLTWVLEEKPAINRGRNEMKEKKSQKKKKRPSSTEHGEESFECMNETNTDKKKTKSVVENTRKRNIEQTSEICSEMRNNEEAVKFKRKCLLDYKDIEGNASTPLEVKSCVNHGDSGNNISSATDVISTVSVVVDDINHSIIETQNDLDIKTDSDNDLESKTDSDDLESKTDSDNDLESKTDSSDDLESEAAADAEEAAESVDSMESESASSASFIKIADTVGSSNSLWDSFQKGDSVETNDDTLRTTLGESIVAQIAKARKSSKTKDLKLTSSAHKIQPPEGKGKTISNSDCVSVSAVVDNSNSQKCSKESGITSDFDQETDDGDCSSEDSEKNDLQKVKLTDSEDTKNCKEQASEDSTSSSSESISSTSEDEKDDKTEENKMSVAHLCSPKKNTSDSKLGHDLTTNNNPTRKKFSEENRLKSLEERLLKDKERRDLVKSSLQKVDSKDGKTTQKHITFDSSDDDDDEDEESEMLDKDEKDAIGSKVTGNAAVSWLGLNASDESDEEKENEHSFSIKPQFEGAKGKHLFKLQQKIGLDDRFRIDERFIDNEDENAQSDQSDIVAAPLHNDDADDDKDNIDYDIQAEKLKALSILEQVLGKKPLSLTAAARKAVVKQQQQVRYDPTRDDHAQYEIQHEASGEGMESTNTSDNDESKKADEVTEEQPVVSEEKFYEVASSIKDLFQTQGSSGFSFLKDDENIDKKEEKADETSLETISKPKSKYLNFLKDNMEEDMEVEPEETMERQKPIFLKFFFTVDDPRLQSTAIDGPAAFKRTESLDEISAVWEKTRDDLRQDYKKKHKDALRRRKKLTERRPKVN